jgi:AcrR family transcriptional regulator
MGRNPQIYSGWKMLSNWKHCVKADRVHAMTTMQTSTAPRRHPPDGGYARGEETRALIITAALDAFAEEGYARASTRSIAASAGVNPPALQYYFGGKEGLHRACAQQIIDRAHQVLVQPYAQAREAAASGDHEEAVEALVNIFDALIDGLKAAKAQSWIRFMARAQADRSEPAVGMIRKDIGVPMIGITAQLIGVITHQDSAKELTRLRACTLVGMVSHLCTHRDQTLAMMHWPRLTQQRLALIKSVVRENTRCLLKGLTKI